MTGYVKSKLITMSPPLLDGGAAPTLGESI